MMSKQNAVLLAALETLGREWQDNCLPQVLLLDETRLSILLQVDDLVWDPCTNISANKIRDHAPSFYEQFGEATLRELGAPFGHPRELAQLEVSG